MQTKDHDKPITIVDIAIELNLSPSTVSRALRNHSDIKLETKTRVKNFAIESGYTPNLTASRFRTKKSNILVILVDDLKSSQTTKILEHLLEANSKTEYQFIIHRLPQQESENIELLKRLKSYNVESTLVASKKGTQLNSYLSNLNEDFLTTLIFIYKNESDKLLVFTTKNKKVFNESFDHDRSFDTMEMIRDFPLLECVCKCSLDDAVLSQMKIQELVEWLINELKS